MLKIFLKLSFPNLSRTLKNFIVCSSNRETECTRLKPLWLDFFVKKNNKTSASQETKFEDPSDEFFFCCTEATLKLEAIAGLENQDDSSTNLV
jgi:hypothetical protein